jgi:hypothetical protein
VAISILIANAIVWLMVANNQSRLFGSWFVPFSIRLIDHLKKSVNHIVIFKFGLLNNCWFDWLLTMVSFLSIVVMFGDN